MLCDSPLCRDGIVVIKFTKLKKTAAFYFRLQAVVHFEAKEATEHTPAPVSTTARPPFYNA